MLSISRLAISNASDEDHYNALLRRQDKMVIMHSRGINQSDCELLPIGTTVTTQREDNSLLTQGNIIAHEIQLIIQII